MVFGLKNNVFDSLTISFIQLHTSIGVGVMIIGVAANPFDGIIII